MFPFFAVHRKYRLIFFIDDETVSLPRQLAVSRKCSQFNAFMQQLFIKSDKLNVTCSSKSHHTPEKDEMDNNVTTNHTEEKHK